MADKKKEIRRVVIDEDGRVTCGASYTMNPICFKWRSELACNKCPMQELIRRSKQNKDALGFERISETSNR